MEKRDAVFYARIKPTTKRAVIEKMLADGYDNLSVWFEQFLAQTLAKKSRTSSGTPGRKKAKKKNASNKKRVSRRS